MAAAAVSLIAELAPLAEQLIANAIDYEKARAASGNSTAPTAAQLVAEATAIEQTDNQIIANANAETSSGAPSA